MREFRVFFSDNEGSVMFFKRDWEEEKQDSHWKPSKEQMKAFELAKDIYETYIPHSEKEYVDNVTSLECLYNDLKALTE